LIFCVADLDSIIFLQKEFQSKLIYSLLTITIAANITGYIT